ncbi:hypothetical protein pipiens_014822 [Culex pipiens pipiens]|uniref:Uncharacterized protein n=1 Tax=Culex pipiens pipiens TaxID=38569 RepID=A0ABD1CT00_CULPP
MTSGKISDCGNHGHIGLEPVVMQEVHYIGTHYQIFHPKQLFIGEEDKLHEAKVVSIRHLQDNSDHTQKQTDEKVWAAFTIGSWRIAARRKWLEKNPEICLGQSSVGAKFAADGMQPKGDKMAFGEQISQPIQPIVR